MPGVAVVTAFILVLVSIAVLVMYVHHIGQALRVSALIEWSVTNAQAARTSLPGQGAGARLRPNGVPVVCAAESGVITGSARAAVEEGGRAGCLLELVPALGEFIPAGAPLFRVHGDSRRG